MAVDKNRTLKLLELKPQRLVVKETAAEELSEGRLQDIEPEPEYEKPSNDLGGAKHQYSTLMLVLSDIFFFLISQVIQALTAIYLIICPDYLIRVDLPSLKLGKEE
jgi:hypothetical protein